MLIAAVPDRPVLRMRGEVRLGDAMLCGAMRCDRAQGAAAIGLCRLDWKLG